MAPSKRRTATVREKGPLIRQARCASTDLKWATSFWLRLRFDLLSAVALFLVTVLALRSGIDQGFAAFGILTSRMFVNALHEIIWWASRSLYFESLCS
jgi:hypothetical protein